MTTRKLPIRVVIAVMLATILIFSAYARDHSQPVPPRRTYVLVHGAWGGGWAFRRLAALIRQAGHDVYRPTLTGLGERVHLASPSVGLETHIQDIVNLIEFEGLEQVILVGHSYGGMVISGVAARSYERLARLIYIDAHLPENGQSMFDLIPAERKQQLISIARAQGDGWRIPPQWANPGKNVPQPLATFQDPVKLSKLGAATLSGSYVLTVEPGVTEDAFSESALRAENRGWKIYRLETGHNPHWSMPDKLVDILLESP